MTHARSNFNKFEQSYPGIENKFNKNFIDIINKTIEHHLSYNDGKQGRIPKEYLLKMIYSKHIPTFIPEADLNKDKELYEYIGDRVSEEFKKYIGHWKQYQKDFPKIFTKQALLLSKPIAKKFLPIKKSTVTQFTKVEQLEQPKQKKIENVLTDNIVTFKIDGIKDNFFTITYCNVTKSDKEILSKHAVQMLELLNNKHRELF